MTVEKKRSFIINITFVAIIVALIYVVMKYAFTLLLPFIIGLIVAVILQKPVSWLTEKTKIPRAIWSVIMVVLLLSAVLGFISLVGYRLYEELQQLIISLSETLPSLSNTLSSASDWYARVINRLPDTMVTTINSAANSAAQSILGYLSDLVTTFAKVTIENLPTVLLSAVISVIACCFITTDYNKITAFVLKQFSEEHQKVIKKSKTLFVENIVKVLRGYILIMAITYFELLIGLSLIKIKYAGVIALLIAILDILPILGTGGVLIPWGIIAILLGDTWLGVEILLLYAVITIIRNVIEPKIIGQQVGLPAFVTLLSMYIGLRLFGIFGVWLMPLLVIIVAKLQEAGMIHVWKSVPKTSSENTATPKKKTAFFHKKP